MCTTCGCGDGDTRIDGVPVADHEHVHTHADGRLTRIRTSTSATTPHGRAGARWHRHADGSWHSHDHGPGRGRAARCRARTGHRRRADRADRARHPRQERRLSRAPIARWLADRGVFALNLVSSPGSGKTTLLVRTIEALAGAPCRGGDRGRPADLARRRSRARDRRAGDPDQHRQGLPSRRPHGRRRRCGKLPLADGSLLLIENVGNLVCPAAFDLGEAHKVVILSVTEGEDKPIKYPDMFHAADLLLVNKIDLLPHLDFDVEAAVAFAHRVRPGLEVHARVGEPPARVSTPGSPGSSAASPRRRRRATPTSTHCAGAWPSSRPGSRPGPDAQAP